MRPNVKPNCSQVKNKNNSSIAFIFSLGQGFDTELNIDGELKGFVATFSSVFFKFLS